MLNKQRNNTVPISEQNQINYNIDIQCLY